MKKHLLWFAPLALGLAACTDKDLTPEDVNNDVNIPEESVSSTQPLNHVKLEAIPSDPSRVSNYAATRADDELTPGTLKLIAEIKNPSKLDKEEGNDFTLDSGKDARYLSATCVYYDEDSKTYYATYHMQGNNYNTQLDRDVAGLIETFTIDADGPHMGKIYRSADPSQLDFDFNHLYFDNLSDYGDVTNHPNESKRLIAVGHLVEPTSSGKNQTKAIISKLNIEEGDPFITYSVVYTGDKILDAAGKSQGKEDAQDVNAVIRSYDTYYLATRKGIALIDANESTLFNPIMDYNDEPKNYFIKTPGSVKHVSHTNQTSECIFLYLTEQFTENGATFDYNREINAKLIKFSIHPERKGPGMVSLGFLGNGTKRITNIENESEYFLDYVVNGWNLDIKNPISPVDGKNVLFMLPGSDTQIYAALGKGGLYYRNNNGTMTEGYLKFGDRPVNGVFADDWNNEKNDGFIYVCNGAKLTIFNRYELNEVASWNLPKKEDGSANYVTVHRNEDGTRIITVAFGQAGLKIFKFTPPVN